MTFNIQYNIVYVFGHVHVFLEQILNMIYVVEIYMQNKELPLMYSLFKHGPDDCMKDRYTNFGIQIALEVLIPLSRDFLKFTPSLPGGRCQNTF